MKSVQCFADFFDKSRWRIFLNSRLEKGYYGYGEKSRPRTTRYRVFLQRKYLDSVRSIQNCLTAEKRYDYFKGQGPLKFV
jgi:hypothetical protein